MVIRISTSNFSNCNSISSSITGTSVVVKLACVDVNGLIILRGPSAPAINTLRIENLDRGGIYILEITVNSASAPCVVTQEYSILNVFIAGAILLPESITIPSGLVHW